MPLTKRISVHPEQLQDTKVNRKYMWNMKQNIVYMCTHAHMCARTCSKALISVFLKICRDVLKMEFIIKEICQSTKHLSCKHGKFSVTPRMHVQAKLSPGVRL